MKSKVFIEVEISSDYRSVIFDAARAIADFIEEYDINSDIVRFDVIDEDSAAIRVKPIPLSGLSRV